MASPETGSVTTPSSWRITVVEDEWGTITYRIDEDEGRYISDAQQAANARLMEAAPDLLAALAKITMRYVSLVESGDCGNWDAGDEDEVKNARAAIAKATEPRSGEA